jgi:hypothetical protein
VEGSAKTALPPRDLAAPRLKSTWPPTPEKNFEPMESAHTWPVRSTSRAVFTATILLADDERVVDVFCRVEREEGVVVDVIIKPVGAQSETGHDLALVYRLTRTSNSTRFDQVNDTVGDHFRVDAEILFAFEETEERLRDTTNAECNGTAVFHEGADEFGDPRGRFSNLRRRHLQEGRLGRHMSDRNTGV